MKIKIAKIKKYIKNQDKVHANYQALKFYKFYLILILNYRYLNCDYITIF